VLLVIGTRPEAIKMAPVAHELARHAPAFEPIVCATGQHRELLAPTLELLELTPDLNLDVMVHDQTLAGLTARLFELLDRVVADTRPDWILVQGDTTSAMVGSMVGFYRRVRVGHIEAGLRTADLTQPFPEEMNRRVADLCADLCFAPTPWARDNLLREGVPSDRVHVTGNTIVDAVLAIERQPYDASSGALAAVPQAPRWVLVTAHRRESFGEPLERICRAVQQIGASFGSSIHLIVPVHPNPNVRTTVSRMLDLPNCSVVPPLHYRDLVHILSRAALVLTDSGGIQEEAPTFGVPVLVLRDKTERPEGVDAGVAKLVGTDTTLIVSEATAILAAAAARTAMANPYGDGHAAARIVDLLRHAPSAIATAPAREGARHPV
jgi:UDP-N-acetylglucosamine 2-epimerase (non-hydrolysing)